MTSRTLIKHVFNKSVPYEGTMSSNDLKVVKSTGSLLRVWLFWSLHRIHSITTLSKTPRAHPSSIPYTVWWQWDAATQSSLCCVFLHNWVPMWCFKSHVIRMYKHEDSAWYAVNVCWIWNESPFSFFESTCRALKRGTRSKNKAPTYPHNPWSHPGSSLSPPADGCKVHVGHSVCSGATILCIVATR